MDSVALSRVSSQLSKRRVVTSSSFSELMTTQLREFHMVCLLYLYIHISLCLSLSVGFKAWAKTLPALSLERPGFTTTFTMLPQPWGW